MLKKLFSFFTVFTILLLVYTSLVIAQENPPYTSETHLINIDPSIADYIYVDSIEVEQGEIVVITIVPPSGHRLAENGITVTGIEEIIGNVLGSTVVSFTMPENAVEIHALFDEIIILTVSVDPEVANYVRVSPNEAEEGQSINIHITPREGYRLMENGISVTNASNLNGNTAASTLVTFIMPSDNAWVSATFELIPVYALYVEQTFEAYLSVNHAAASAGQIITVTITPPRGHRLSENGITATDTTVFEGNVVGSTSVSFVKTEGNTMLSADFEQIPVYSIVIASGVEDYLHVDRSSSEEGQNIIITVKPPDGQRLAENGISATGVTELRGNTAGSTIVIFTKTGGDTEIRAIFEPIPSYSVTIAPSAVDYAVVNLDRAEVGQTIVVEITPPTGQRLAENGVRATGTTGFRGNTAGSLLVAFDKTAGDTEINISFEPISPAVYFITVEASAMPYTQVYPLMAEVGQTVTVTITPPSGQRLARNGVSATGVTSIINNIAGSTTVTFQKTSGDTVIAVRFETTFLTFSSSFVSDPIRTMLTVLLLIVLAFFAIYVVQTRKKLKAPATVSIISTNDTTTLNSTHHGHSSIGMGNMHDMRTATGNGGNAIKPTPKITINSKTNYSPTITSKPFDFQGKTPNPQNAERRYLIFTKESWGELQGSIDWGMHTHRNRVEQGGVLLGRAYKYKNEIYNFVKRVILADTKGSPAFVEFSNKTWAQMQDELSRINEKLGTSEQIFITGWFHTHPNGLSVFMSGTDQNTQQLNFNQDWQASLVLNPHTHEYEAYFGYKHDGRSSERNMPGKMVEISNVSWIDLE